MKHNNKQELFLYNIEEAIRDNYNSDYGRCISSISDIDRQEFARALFEMQDRQSQKDIITDITDNFPNNRNIHDYFCWCFPEMLSEYFNEEINIALEKAYLNVSSEYNNMDLSELGERLLEDQLEKARLAKDINLGR